MQVVSNLDIGGAQEVVRTLAENLTDIGCVTVVCTFQDGPLRAEIEQLGIPVEILSERRNSVVAFPLFLTETLQLRRELTQLVQKYQIDVIQTHLLRSMDFLVLSVRSKKGPKVFWTFQNALFDLREEHLQEHKWLFKPKRASHHMLYRLGSYWVDGMVAVSDDVKRSILGTMNGMQADKISVIPNSVDITRYGEDSGRNVLRQNLGFSDAEHLMAVVATFKRQKGHIFLIEAASKLTRKFPDLHFLLLGDGELRVEMQSLSSDLGLENNIHFLGTRNDVPQILSASDSFILPSLWEGLPMALVEAMASGLPIIATDVSGTRQVMVPGETGYMIPPGNSQEIILAVTAMLTNPTQSQLMGNNARQRVEDMWSAEKQARDIVTLFSQA
jgi:glycosyltransferase involved in cell wall biosynthesis